VESLGDILGCEVAILPMKYLGLPLRASYKSIHIWDGVIEKIERQLANWKRLYLSKVGRVTLIKSTLANLYVEYPCQITHVFCLFFLPTSVGARIKKLQ
jgi:hypothetical protein